jgi:hypothetical protein
MCNCAAEADLKLESMNTAIDYAMLIQPSGKVEQRLQIKVGKRDKRKRQGPIILVAKFCPFCGKDSASSAEGNCK